MNEVLKEYYKKQVQQKIAQAKEAEQAGNEKEAAKLYDEARRYSSANMSLNQL